MMLTFHGAPVTVLSPWGRHAMSGEERVVGKKRCGMRVSLVHLQVCFKLGVILGLETQSRIGRKFGGEMHRVVGERIFVGTR
jgi:hypothetical protein